jgi:ATP/ADP translocase
VKRFDVVALVTGICFLGLALAILANALVGPVSWALVKVVAPVVLVVVGVAGLALSRRP